MRHIFYDSLKRFLMALIATLAFVVPTFAAANLPSGYTELEYIESTGTQYIDTGVIEDATYYEEVDFQFTNVSQDRNYLIGHLGSSGNDKDRTVIGMYKPNST